MDDPARIKEALEDAEPFLERLAAMFAPTHAAVEDYLQEARIAAWRSAHRYVGENGASTRTFILSVAANRLKDLERRRRAKRRGGGATQLPLGTASNVPDTRLPGCEQQVIASIHSEQMLSRLSPLERDAVRLLVCDRRSERDAATTLKISIETLRSARSSGLAKLRDAIA